MPEICELRTDADSLDFYLSHRQLLSISFNNDKFKNKSKGLEDLAKELPLTIIKVRSRAKKLFIFLENNNGKNWFIYLSYGMSGKITLQQEKHSHIQFTMSHNWLGFNTFYYTDTRRIGSFETSSEIERYDYHVTDMAKPVVLGYKEKDFQPITKEEFIKNIHNCKKSYLVSKLMDQRSICSGVGNYLLSEVLYEAKIDPFIHCDELTDKKITNLWDGLHKVITKSYKYGGVSMVDYTHIDGTLGEYEQHLKVYGKAGEIINGQKILSCKGPHGRTIFYIDYKK